MKAQIFQIFYSEETQRQNDSGFLPLDNLSNPRPDWREYWPIRNFLLNQPLQDDVFYGFLSPRFFEKTGLSSTVVNTFIQAQPADTNIILFSPLFDQSAFYLNPFEQAASHHPAIAPTLDAAFAYLGSKTSVETWVMHSMNTVFCNYFVAKPVFWKTWLHQAEQLFSQAESQQTALGRDLSSTIDYGDAPTPKKVFALERVVSFLLATQSWKVKAFNTMDLPYSSPQTVPYKDALCLLDALKFAYSQTQHSQYLKQFHTIKSGIIKRLQG